jgi:hypothetical protein
MFRTSNTELIDWFPIDEIRILTSRFDWHVFYLFKKLVFNDMIENLSNSLIFFFERWGVEITGELQK